MGLLHAIRIAIVTIPIKLAVVGITERLSLVHHQHRPIYSSRGVRMRTVTLTMTLQVLLPAAKRIYMLSLLGKTMNLMPTYRIIMK